MLKKIEVKYQQTTNTKKGNKKGWPLSKICKPIVSERTQKGGFGFEEKVK